MLKTMNTTFAFSRIVILMRSYSARMVELMWVMSIPRQSVWKSVFNKKTFLSILSVHPVFSMASLLIASIPWRALLRHSSRFIASSTLRTWKSIPLSLMQRTARLFHSIWRPNWTRRQPFCIRDIGTATPTFQLPLDGKNFQKNCTFANWIAKQVPPSSSPFSIILGVSGPWWPVVVPVLCMRIRFRTWDLERNWRITENIPVRHRRNTRMNMPRH
mmetsp:Transcript_2352/g.3693  ORF Transcript_2352/g.3693 Transcript_2352/m.3693 type:complete len:216 (-) Transcript_2352:3221-3868(-)